MRILGLDVALAPVLDLDPGTESPVLGTRCFGDDPDAVVRLGLAWLQGLSSAGVLGCLKHYPGHGATRLDSHLQLPRVGDEAASRRHRSVFEEVAAAWQEEDAPEPSVLTAHILVASSALPVSLDPKTTNSIPAGLGPVWTDSLDMGALAPFGDLQSRVEASGKAGADFLIVGVESSEGLKIAHSLSLPWTPKARSWAASAERELPIPEPWDPTDLARTARKALRVLTDPPIPFGGWDWVLPDRFKEYGKVARPSRLTGGTRWIETVHNYDAGRPETIRAVLEAIPTEKPVLLGWIHRGAPDEGTVDVLRRRQKRIRAVAHLLDTPAAPISEVLWSADTSGFGEAEIDALLAAWIDAPGE
jgi:hypothetical protein